MILFRCDAAVEIGAGHVMRCLALAQAAHSAGYPVAFVMARVTPLIEQRIHNDRFEIHRIGAQAGIEADAEETLRVAAALKASWIVTDSYSFDANYHRLLGASGAHRLLQFDDFGRMEFYCADIVLNQNLDADARNYVRRSPRTQLLAGSEYALLRPEFLRWKDWRRQTKPDGNRVLITLGGSDPNNVTLALVQALENPAAGKLELDVIAGGANPHFNLLEQACGASRHAARLAVNVTDMAERMAQADVAITAGGSTVWELCLMQLPAIVILLGADQEFGGAKLAEHGAVISLGYANDNSMRALASKLRTLLDSSELRMEMGARGRRLIDGNGAQRVVAAMSALERLQP